MKDELNRFTLEQLKAIARILGTQDSVSLKKEALIRDIRNKKNDRSVDAAIAAFEEKNLTSSDRIAKKSGRQTLIVGIIALVLTAFGLLIAFRQKDNEPRQQVYTIDSVIVETNGISERIQHQGAVAHGNMDTSSITRKIILSKKCDTCQVDYLIIDAKKGDPLSVLADQYGEIVLSGTLQGHQEFISAWTLATIQLLRNNYEQALRMFSNMDPVVNKKFEDVFLKMGICNFFLGNYYRAAVNLHSAVKIDPDNVMANIGLGILYQFKLENPDSALFFYRRSIDLKDDYPNVFNNVGVLYSRKHQFDRSIDFFNRSLALKGDDPTTFFNISLMYARQQKNDSAAANMQRALELNPRIVRYIKGEKDFDCLATDRSFQNLIKRYNNASGN